MTSLPTKLVAAALFSVATLSGCGGGDESSGSATPFSIAPDTVTITGPDADTCAGPILAPSSVARVFVYGGAGPYRVDVTFPDLMSVSPVSYSGTQAYFDVYLLTAACISPGTIVVVDLTGRTTNLTVISAKGN